MATLNEIKQHTKVTYLGCILDNNLVLGLINARLKFLYRKQKFLFYSLHQLLCSALIQPLSDYARSAWYTSLNKQLLKKSTCISQNKCIRYCLKLDNRAHIGANKSKKINWKKKVSRCICINIFKFFNNMALHYTSEISFRHTVGTIHACLHIKLISKTFMVRNLCLILVQNHRIV